MLTIRKWSPGGSFETGAGAAARAVALGIFDGVHLGHRAVISKATGGGDAGGDAARRGVHLFPIPLGVAEGQRVGAALPRSKDQGTREPGGGGDAPRGFRADPGYVPRGVCGGGPRRLAPRQAGVLRLQLPVREKRGGRRGPARPIVRGKGHRSGDGTACRGGRTAGQCQPDPPSHRGRGSQGSRPAARPALYAGFQRRGRTEAGPAARYPHHQPAPARPFCPPAVWGVRLERGGGRTGDPRGDQYRRAADRGGRRPPGRNLDRGFHRGSVWKSRAGVPGAVSPAGAEIRVGGGAAAADPADGREARRAVLGDSAAGIRAVLFDFDDTLQDRSRAFDKFTAFFMDKYFPHLSGEEKARRGIEMRERNNGDMSIISTISPLSWRAGAGRVRPRWETCTGSSSSVFPSAPPCSPRQKRCSPSCGGGGSCSGSSPTAPPSNKTGSWMWRACGPFVDLCMVSGDEQVHKPDLEIFRRAASRLGVACGSCLYVGDHPVNDIEGAAAAGMRPVYINAARRDFHPDNVIEIHSLRELLDVV